MLLEELKRDTPEFGGLFAGPLRPGGVCCGSIVILLWVCCDSVVGLLMFSSLYYFVCC